MFALPDARSARSQVASRREFLKTGAIAFGGLALPAISASFAHAITSATRGNKSVIFVYLAGGPSHLDMYDMKPSAPAEIRGEFRPIATNVPGMHVCEHLPLHAKIADKFAIVNGLESFDIHDPSVMANGERCATGARVDVLVPSREAGPDRLEFAEQRSIELPHGDWDTHGRVLGRQLSIFQELRDKLPAYDRFLHDLIADVYDRGVDKDVLIIAAGEFGRTPSINEHGGRNHWAPCGSILFAGGGLKIGQVIGDTGPIGEREQSRSQPYTWNNLYATMYNHLGVDLASAWPGAEPIAELI